MTAINRLGIKYEPPSGGGGHLVEVLEITPYLFPEGYYDVYEVSNVAPEALLEGKLLYGGTEVYSSPRPTMDHLHVDESLLGAGYTIQKIHHMVWASRNGQYIDPDTSDGVRVWEPWKLYNPALNLVTSLDKYSVDGGYQYDLEAQILKHNGMYVPKTLNNLEDVVFNSTIKGLVSMSWTPYPNTPYHYTEDLLPAGTDKRSVLWNFVGRPASLSRNAAASRGSTNADNYFTKIREIMVPSDAAADFRAAYLAADGGGIATSYQFIENRHILQPGEVLVGDQVITQKAKELMLNSDFYGKGYHTYTFDEDKNSLKGNRGDQMTDEDAAEAKEGFADDFAGHDLLGKLQTVKMYVKTGTVITHTGNLKITKQEVGVLPFNPNWGDCYVDGLIYAEVILRFPPYIPAKAPTNFEEAIYV